MILPKPGQKYVKAGEAFVVEAAHPPSGCFRGEVIARSEFQGLVIWRPVDWASDFAGIKPEEGSFCVWCSEPGASVEHERSLREGPACEDRRACVNRL